MDTIIFNRALEQYQTETGNARPVSELPVSVISHLLQMAQALKDSGSPETDLEQARR